MVDYSKLSDFEVNCKVALALGFDLYKYGKSCQENHVAIQEGRCGTFAMDWCNNPADAWPIIVSKKICIAFDVFAEPDDGGGWVASPAYCVEGERIRHDNPLRAAMIVFLMMQDAKNG